MRITVGKLRKIIRGVLSEYGNAASGTDPTDKKGFYPYEIERGTDIHSFWYKSPGRGAGADGDPGRPSDAADYLGMVPKKTAEEPEGSSGGEDAGSETQPAAAPAPAPQQAQPKQK